MSGGWITYTASTIVPPSNYQMASFVSWEFRPFAECKIVQYWLDMYFYYLILMAVSPLSFIFVHIVHLFYCHSFLESFFNYLLLHQVKSNNYNPIWIILQYIISIKFLINLKIMLRWITQILQYEPSNPQSQPIFHSPTQEDHQQILHLNCNNHCSAQNYIKLSYLPVLSEFQNCLSSNKSGCLL